MSTIRTNVRSIALPLARAMSAVAYGIAPAWTANTIRAAFFVPRPFPTRPHHQALLDRARPFTVPTLGRAVRGWEWGEGPPVLLSHGWASRGIQLHRFVEPLVAAGFQVVAYDNPAHGESDGRHSNALEFQLAFDAVRARYPHPAAIVAHSMGGVAALRHAEQTPLPVVLVSPLYQLRRELSTWAVQAGLARHVFNGIVGRVERALEVALDPISPHRIAPAIHAPVLILHDHHDRTTSIHEARQLHRNLAAGRLIETCGLGHNGILRSPSLIDQAVRFIVEARGVAAAPPMAMAALAGK